MLKIYLEILLIYSFFSLITSDNTCSSPVECYTKAIAILNQDRADMRKETDLLKSQIAELKRTIEGYEKTIIGYDKNLADFKLQTENKINEDKKEFIEKINSIANKNNSLSSNKNIPDMLRCGDGREPGAVFLLHNYDGGVGSGQIYYFQVGSKRNVIFSREGLFLTINSDDHDTVNGCFRKSLQQLRAEGRAFNIVN